MGSIGFSKHLGCRQQILDVSSQSRQAPSFARFMGGQAWKSAFVHLFCMVTVFGVRLVRHNSRSFFFIMMSAAPSVTGHPDFDFTAYDLVLHLFFDSAPKLDIHHTRRRLSSWMGHYSHLLCFSLDFSYSAPSFAGKRPKRSIIPPTYRQRIWQARKFLFLFATTAGTATVYTRQGAISSNFFSSFATHCFPLLDRRRSMRDLVFF